MRKIFSALLMLIIVLPIFISLSFTPCVLASEISEKSEKLTLKIKNNFINLQAENVSFISILQEIEKQSEIRVSIHEDVHDRKVSLNIKDLPIYAISTLLEQMKIENFALIYDKELDREVIYVLPYGHDLSEAIKDKKDKTVIRPARFLNNKEASLIKGREILIKTDDANKIPVRYVKDELILRFHRGVTQNEIEALLEKYNLIRLDSEHLAKIGHIKVRIPDGREVYEVIKEITREYKIKTGEPNYISDILTITDPLYKFQWYVPDTKFDKAWGELLLKKRIKVAVIDTGVDKNHPDLQNKILEGYDFVDNDFDPLDTHGHGTFIAGIIAANSNGIGIKGLYDYAEIIPIRVINANGIGTYEDVAKGIIYAVDNGAKVINLSIGGYAYSFLLQDAVDYALENGCILVASGGNDGLKQAIYPAAYPDVIGVSAIGQNGLILPLSNSGKHIDVAAPGENIISTGLNREYLYATGTSASTAMVSALAAMLLSERPDLSSSAIQRLVLQSAKDLGENGRDKIYGSGEIDASTALEQKVKPFHNVAVRRVNIEPLKFEKGSSTFIVAEIMNSGTYNEEKCDVIFYEINGEVKKEIGRKNAIIVIDKLKVSLEWKPDGSIRNIEIIRFDVFLVSKNDSNSSDNSKRTNNITVKEVDGVYILYKTEPPVHQWIGLQAYNKLPAGNLKNEMSNYLPTSNTSSYYASTFSPPSGWGNNSNEPYTSSTSLIEGMWEEDESTRGSYMRSCDHYWNVDGGYNDGYSGVCIGIDWNYDSALKVAQEESFKNAVANYSGNKLLAYYWLGRAAHLLMDMSVPEHVHNDPHPFDSYFEGYEYFTGTNYQAITSVSSNTEIPNIDSFPAYFGYTPTSYDTKLTKLLYNLAESANDFDSNDNNGESYNYGKGKFRFARNQLAVGKSVSRVEYWGLFSRIRTLTRYIDYDVIQNSCEYRIYYYESFYNEINNTINRVRVYYTDGSDDSFYNLDENILNEVFSEPLRCIYQPELQARAIGYVAALYQLFWDSTHGFASVSNGVTVTPSPVILGQNFTVSFTLQETRGAPIIFENVAVAILRSDNSLLFDLAMYNNVTIPANGTWGQSPTGQIFTSNPPGTYKAVIRGKLPGGNWFDFSVTGSGVIREISRQFPKPLAQILTSLTRRLPKPMDH